MPVYDRAYYTKLVEQDYFGNVMKEDIAAACACFTEDSEVVIYHGDNPVRRFYGTPKDGQLPLDAFYEHLLGNYGAKFEHFEHTIDLEYQRCAANFLVTLTPKPGSTYETTGTLTLNNSNFFRCRDGKIYYMVIYYANPTLGEKLGVQTTSPTGFPKS
jgi:ketosteroid isomerase-like protein